MNGGGGNLVFKLKKILLLVCKLMCLKMLYNVPINWFIIKAMILQLFCSIADDMASHSSTLKTPEGHIANPVNAYLFVKRFTIDWDRDVASVLTGKDIQGNVHWFTYELKNYKLLFLQ